MPVLPTHDKEMAERLMFENKKAAEQKAQKEQSNSSNEPQTLAKAEDHHAMPGPAIVDGKTDLGEVQSKEALKKRAEELNQ